MIHAAALLWALPLTEQQHTGTQCPGWADGGWPCASCFLCPCQRSACSSAGPTIIVPRSPFSSPSLPACCFSFLRLTSPAYVLFLRPDPFLPPSHHTLHTFAQCVSLPSFQRVLYSLANGLACRKTILLTELWKWDASCRARNDRRNGKFGAHSHFVPRATPPPAPVTLRYGFLDKFAWGCSIKCFKRFMRESSIHLPVLRYTQNITNSGQMIIILRL